MAFEAFKKMVNSMVRKSNETLPESEQIRVEFYDDSGDFCAICSNGVRFFGSSSSKKFRVKFR